MANWGYTKENGPHKWGEVAPAARGLHQSPVNIETDKIDKCSFSQPLNFVYIPSSCKKILNNGHTIQVVIDGKNSLFEGGPLCHRYKAAQFHFHWGRNSSSGSEHQVDGKYFAAELHIVHWNSDLCASVEEAAKSATGLAVLTVLIQSGSHHGEIEKVTSILPKVNFKGESVDLKDGLDIAALLPKKRDYWTYCGSLTTPPCYESARFIIFKEPIQVSESQLQALRELHSHSRDCCTTSDEFGGKILQNFRPVNPLNDRKIFSSC